MEGHGDARGNAAARAADGAGSDAVELGPYYFVFALCLALTGAFLLIGPVGLPLAFSYVVIAFIAPASVRLTFDGRALRVNPEAEARARELREWCSIAAREKA